MASHDLLGLTFGRLTVISKGGFDSHGKRLWRCRCECGNSIETITSSLNRGATRSCGCLQREAIRRTALHHNSDGHNYRHGRCDTPIYRSWQNMMARCYTPSATSYPYYGGASPPIRVYEPWHDFSRFLTEIVAEIGERPPGKSIDRWPDNAGDYRPGNVRWATPKQQANNRRN